jgi:hypothetical protein
MSATTTTSRKWVPFAMAAGTTAIIIVPLFWIRRQRGHTLGQALSAGTSTPTTAASAIRFARGSQSPVINTTAPTRAQPAPTPPSLFTALSHADMSSSLYAAKALGIATILVAFAGLGLVSGIKAVMGLSDVCGYFSFSSQFLILTYSLQMNQFAQHAREVVQTHMPSLSKAIYRLPDTPLDLVDPALQPIALQLDNELLEANKRLNT